MTASSNMPRPFSLPSWSWRCDCQIVWDVLVDASARPTQDHYHLKATIPVFRAVGSLPVVALVWLWAASLAVFDWARINYVALLDLDPRSGVGSCRAMVCEACNTTLVFCASALLYFKGLRRDGFTSIAPSTFPLLMCV